MKNEIFSILKNLVPKQRIRLKEFLSSSQYTHNKNLTIFYNLLIKFYPDFNISLKQKKEMFAFIYGNKEYNDSTYRSLIHLLRNRIEDFLVFEQALNNQKNRTLSLLKFYYDSNINGAFDKSIQHLEKTFYKNYSEFSSDDLLQIYHMEVLKYNFNKTNIKTLHNKSILSKSININVSGITLTLHYFIEMVSDFVIQVTLMNSFEYKSLTNYNLESIFNIELLKSMFKNDVEKKVFSLYLLLYRLFSKPNNESNYSKYKKSVEEHIKRMKSEDAAFHYSCLVSYSLIKKNLGKNQKYEVELWYLYQQILEKKLYSNSKNKYLDISLYRAILFLGLKLKLFEHVKIFIDNYYTKVIPKEVKNIFHLSYAYYCYEKNQLDDALNHAKYIRLSDFIFKYDVKNLLVKLYYELKYWDSLESVIHSYREFLRNDKILNANNKLKLLNFLTFVENLIKISESKDKLDYDYLKTRLTKTENVYAKVWLLEKLIQIS